MQFKKSILGISLIAMSIGLIGCGNSNDTTSELPQNRQISRNMTNGRYQATKRGSVRNSLMGNERGELLNSENSYNNSNMGYNNNSNMGYNNNDLARMEKIQQQLNRLTGYNDATCVVNGNTAIVGCSNNNRYSKNEIVDIVKKCDPSINRCEVITTKNGADRIRYISK